jgi:branched-chain amino acid transport system ATP-binding protein
LKNWLHYYNIAAEVANKIRDQENFLKLLLLDEPSLGLAPNLLGNVFKKLVEINREFKIAMLIVEQKVLEVLEICHRVYSIKMGRVAFEGKPEELKGNKQMIKELFL